MKTILLALSLLGNAVLIGAYLIAPAPRAPLPAADLPGAAATTAAPAAGAAAAATPNPVSAPPPFSWAAIETSDLDELERRLQAAGFTPREVRRLLAEKINDLTRPPTAADRGEPTPYWRTGRTEPRDPKAVEAARKLAAEQARLYRKYVMAPDLLADDPEELESARRRWGDLPLEKLQAIAAIEADYQELNLQHTLGQRFRPGEQTSGPDAYRLMEKERMADIAKVLTPEEFAAFELRSSPMAGMLRFRLETFQPTEDEYKALFAIHKAYDDRLRGGPLDAKARNELNQEITRQAAAVLGAERALDFDAAMNHNSQDQTGRLVARLGLPARVAVEVRNAQQDFTQRANDIRTDASLSPADRAARLDALARQAEAQLHATLGEEGYEAYSDLKGEWLRKLRTK